MVLVGIVLYANEYNDERMEPLAHLIGEVSINYQVPITYAATGKTWEALHRTHPHLTTAIKTNFADYHDGFWPGEQPEIITSSDYATALANPHISQEHLHLWHDAFLPAIIGRPKSYLQATYMRTPQGFFPAEMIFSLAQAHCLKQRGFNYVVVGGEFLPENSPKGRVWYPGDENLPAEHQLKILIRENNVALQADTSPFDLKEELKHKANENGGIAIVGCDLPLFTGKYHDEGRGGHPRDKGIHQLVGLAQELHADPETHLWNCNSIANSSWHPQSFLAYLQDRGFEDPWHYISSWMNAEGNLSSARSEVFQADAEFVKNHAFDEGAREEWYPGSGMEHRMNW